MSNYTIEHCTTRVNSESADSGRPGCPPAASAVCDATPPDGPVARVLAGCALLRHLGDKAAGSGHLAHPERLSLLYSLGHLGGAGEQALHAIIGRCANYDRAETDRQIAKLTGLPIGCTRLREKHATPELLPLCICDFGDVRRRGGYPTPSARPRPRARAGGAPGPRRRPRAGRGARHAMSA